MSEIERKRVTRRSFLRLAGALGLSAMASSILGACSPQATPAAPTAASAATEAPAATQAPAATAVPAATEAPAASSGGTVKWAEFYIGTDASTKLNQDWIASVVKQFEDENPGWKVEQEEMQWDQIDEKSIIDLNAGVDHDLMYSSPQLMAKHAKTGDYIDLTEYIKTLPQSEVDDLSWSPGWKSATVNGQQIGIATGVHTRVTAYRRDMFKDAGLDPDKPLTTFDDLVAAGKKLTKADQDLWGLAMYLGPQRGTIELYYGTLVWGLGGEYFDEKAQKATFSSEASIKAVQWLSDVIFKDKITPEYAYAPDGDYNTLVQTNFVQGKAAMAMGFGSYWIGALEQAGFIKGCFPASAACAPDKAGIMPMPGPAFTNAWCLSIHKLSKHADAAWKLMQVILKPENLKTYPDAGLPGRLSAWKTPEYSSPFYKTWLDVAQKGRGVPATPYYAEMADTVAAALQEILSKKADIATTLKKYEDEWNAKYAG